MNMKKTVKIFLILIIIVLLQLQPIQSNIIYASNSSSSIQINNFDNMLLNNSKLSKNEELVEIGFWSDLFSEGESFLSKGETTNSVTVEGENVEIYGINEDALETTSDSIFNALFGIAVVLAVIIGGVLGIKFMLASAEEKADIKSAMIPYIIGCVVVFGAFTIWKIAVNILQKIV